MTNSQLHKVKALATQLFIDGHNPAYDAELQTVLCTIKAFVQIHNATYISQIQFEETIRTPYQSVDDE